MKTLSRKSLIGAFALVASLSAPLAFAQSAEASTQATPPTEAAAQTETSAQGTTAATETTAATAPTAASATPETGAVPAKKSWSDVDADKDGKLTKSEASAVPALSKVFDQADGNADGALTADEYKAYVAQVQGGGKGKDGGK